MIRLQGDLFNPPSDLMMAIAMTKEATKDAEADATCIPYTSGK